MSALDWFWDFFERALEENHGSSAGFDPDKDGDQAGDSGDDLYLN